MIDITRMPIALQEKEASNIKDDLNKALLRCPADSKKVILLHGNYLQRLAWIKEAKKRF